MASRTWYRIVGKKRVSATDMMPSLKGRFHEDPEGEPTSYLGDSLETVWKESISARAHIARPNPEAYRGWRITLEDADLIDLRKEEVREKWKITEGQLESDPPHPRCKEVAREIRKAQKGFHGMIYRSIRNRPNGVCVVLFLENTKVKIESVDAREWDEFVGGLPGQGK